jgi:hypothetical protein
MIHLHVQQVFILKFYSGRRAHVTPKDTVINNIKLNIVLQRS